MTRIRKGNRELVVDESALAAYLNDGYAAIDDHGNVIDAPKQVSFDEAMRENAALKAYQRSLQQTLADKNARIAELETALGAAQAEIDRLNKPKKTKKDAEQ